MAKLGLAAPASPTDTTVDSASGVDKSVEERLERERKEAEEMAKKMEAEREEKEREDLCWRGVERIVGWGY